MHRLSVPRLSLALAGVWSLTACGGSWLPTWGTPDPRDREPGATSFLSADGYQGQASPEGAPPPSSDGDVAVDDLTGGDERTVEEGDIYRVLDSGLVLNLNAYRGLQIVDVSDVQNPAVVGRVQVSGTPVELYAHQDRVYILLNNWTGYWGAREDVVVEERSGGLVLSVDVSDPAAPVVTDRSYIPGWIRKSRMTKSTTSAALYVATDGWGEVVGEDGTASYRSTTYVQSYDVQGGLLEERDLIDLGGAVSDIQATPAALLVARFDWNAANENDGGSHLQVIDISDPAGAMAERADIVVRGRIESQFNMDIHGHILRVVSGNFWNAEANTNFLETFDISDLDAPVLVDAVEFGDGEDLYATLFLDNKAFFVTYQRVDPFHAFAIDDDGVAEERAEFVVSGWNDFFKPAFGESRLLGVGVDDADQEWNLAVSLYDITDLDNPTPLLAREHVTQSGWSWSEARWDHRAFSVLSDAVSVSAPDGTVETGLILLPFTGWDHEADVYRAAVQIFTFSESTLTPRGVMDHGSYVRRSFLAGGATANLSELSLSLFDTTDPDAPVEQGRLELAPNYDDLLRFGAYSVRVKNNQRYTWWWGGNVSTVPVASAEIIPHDDHPDQAAPIASVEIPAGAQVFKSGTHLVAVATRIVDYTQYPYAAETDIHVYDLSVPGLPVETGTFTTDDIQLGYGGGWGYGYYDCIDCGWYYPMFGTGGDNVFAVDTGLVFLTRTPQQKLEGVRHTCNTHPTDEYVCEGGSFQDEVCTYTVGSYTCSHLDDEPDLCSGGFQRCTYHAGNGDYDCEDISMIGVPSETTCYDYDQYRYWQSFSLTALDLRTPGQPALGNTVALPPGDEGISALVADNEVWVSFLRPESMPGDPLPYVRYFARGVNYADVANPEVGVAVNVPGRLLAKHDDQLYTQDLVWGSNVVETAIAKLKLLGPVAVLQGTHVFEDQLVHQVLLDGAGHLLASHRTAWQLWANGEPNLQRLAILDATSLGLKSDTDVDNWGNLVFADAGRAVFAVGGGVLLMNTSNAAAPVAQAYFPYRGWGAQFVVDGDDLVVPAGPHGIYRFDLDTYNLQSE